VPARAQYPTQEQLNAALRYENGLLYWKMPAPKRDLSKPAGHKTRNGYMQFSWGNGTDRKRLSVHRVVWIMHNGFEPDTIDHINRNRSDNRIENLRDVSLSWNHMNRCDTHTVYDLPRGVTMQRGLYKAQRVVNGKQRFIGTYDTPEKAWIAFVAFSKGAGLPVYEA